MYRFIIPQTHFRRTIPFRTFHFIIHLASWGINLGHRSFVFVILRLALLLYFSLTANPGERLNIVWKRLIIYFLYVLQPYGPTATRITVKELLCTSWKCSACSMLTKPDTRHRKNSCSYYLRDMNVMCLAHEPVMLPTTAFPDVGRFDYSVCLLLQNGLGPFCKLWSRLAPPPPQILKVT